MLFAAELVSLAFPTGVVGGTSLAPSCGPRGTCTPASADRLFPA